MNSIQLFEQKIVEALPTVVTELDAPDKVEGLWFLDLDLAGHKAVVSWSVTFGFGLISRADADYGIWGDEYFAELNDAIERTITLLRTRTRTLSLDETDYLLKNPVMRKRLLEARNRTDTMSYDDVRAKLNI